MLWVQDSLFLQKCFTNSVFSTEFIREKSNISKIFNVFFVVDNLQYIWTKLDFHVEKFYNLSETEIMRTLAHYAFKVDHTQFDSFVCCVLTHGE